MLLQTPEDDLRNASAARGCGRLSHSWCMSVVSHGHGEFGGAGMEVVHGMHAGRNQGAGRLSRYAGAHPECEVLPSCHSIISPSRCAGLGRVEPELVGLPVAVTGSPNLLCCILRYFSDFAFCCCVI